MERLFWAKLRGYPWWPAIIENFQGYQSLNTSDLSTDNSIPVRFLGSHDFAVVTKDNLKPFQEFWAQYHSKGTSAKFKQAIREAEDIVTLPMRPVGEKKRRGRPPKARVIERERRKHLIQYCDRKLDLILLRSAFKSKELPIASRILSLLANFSSEELKTYYQDKRLQASYSRFIDMVTSSKDTTLAEAAGLIKSIDTLLV